MDLDWEMFSASYPSKPPSKRSKPKSTSKCATKTGNQQASSSKYDFYDLEADREKRLGPIQDVSTEPMSSGVDMFERPNMNLKTRQPKRPYETEHQDLAEASATTSASQNKRQKSALPESWALRNYLHHTSPAHRSDSPSYYSAQSSPRTSSTPGSYTMSSVYYSAEPSPLAVVSPTHYSRNPSPMMASKSMPTKTGSMCPPELPMVTSEYTKEALSRNLILPVDQELNWSGKANGGQHVEFQRGEGVPLQVIGQLGVSLKAVVEKVRCRRIVLARKTMICGRRLPLQKAFSEVEHLQKLHHPHIIQLVGTYFQGRKFSVLLYPAADHDLDGFFEEVLPITSKSIHSAENSVSALWNFFGCLTESIRYLHSHGTRHLDIKPGNILVKKQHTPSYDYGHRVYIADFGISRSFEIDHSQTDSHVLGTPKYYAPEVWNREAHGRAADIFSLGCVFMEMLTVLCDIDLDEFAEFRSQGDEEYVPYRDSLEKVREWGSQLKSKIQEIAEKRDQLARPWNLRIADSTMSMLTANPQERKLPDYSILPKDTGPARCRWCCIDREVYRAEP